MEPMKTMEYYSAVKGCELMNSSGKWLQLEKRIILRQVTEAQKDKQRKFSLMCGSSFKSSACIFNLKPDISEESSRGPFERLGKKDRENDNRVMAAGSNTGPEGVTL